MSNPSVVLFVLFFISKESKAMDPEKQLCNDLYIDAAVTADDGISYAFKGDFYWKINAVSGISPETIANYIDDRWPGLTGPIDAAFTTDEQNYRLITVFIKGNQWFAYKNCTLQANGTTTNWPYVFQPPVMSAFDYYNSSVDRKEVPIYFIYDTDKFAKYQIKDIERPVQLTSGLTYRKGKFLIFLYDPNDSGSGTTMSSLLNARAVLSDANNLTFFGDSNYCVADITQLAPQCTEPKKADDVKKFYGCPRKPFPTTTTTTTVTTPLSSISSEVFNTSIIETSSEEMEANGVPIKDNSDPFETFNTKITHPLLESKSATDPNQHQNKVEEKSNLWLIAVIAVIVVSCLVTFIGIFVFFVIENKSKSKNKSKDDQGKSHKSDDNETDVIISSRNPRPQLDLSDPKPINPKKSADNTLRLTKDESAIEADQLLQSIKSKEDI